MYHIDLNFLKEDEVEAIVSVIEKDFEVKAAEKARICKLRKQLINKDHKAELLSQSPFEGSFCVLCCSKFFIIINPKRVCCSCGMHICGSCSVFIKKFAQNICLICQQQQDLIAMNCSWFYETIRRKFMEGGSQIVANSLSEYPRKNAISPYILNMVKGAQITKFRHQIEDASSSILDSLRKVEGYAVEESVKSDRYSELIKKFTENLKIILYSTFQVLHITLENYNKKTGFVNQNIDLQVLRILHEEVELLVGKKINIKSFQDTLRRNKKNFDGNEIRENLESKLATAIVEKLISVHQQFLIESRHIQYEDLNVVLKNIVKNENIDFDYDSISQVPSRQGTIQRSQPFKAVPNPLIEVSVVESDDSSKLYSLSGVGERGNIVSKKWNELAQNSKAESEFSKFTQPTDGIQDETDNGPVVPIRRKRSSVSSRKLPYDDEMKIDSDVLTMPANNNGQTNWLMNARQPFGSLNSIDIQSTDPYSNWNKPKLDKRAISQMNLAKTEDDRENSNFPSKSENYFGSLNNLHIPTNDPYITRNKNKVKRNANQRLPTHQHVDEELEAMYNDNKVFVKNTKTPNIDNEYNKNLPFATPNPTGSTRHRPMERTASQDSGVGLSQISLSKPESVINKPRKAVAPSIPVTTNVARSQILKPRIIASKPRSNSNSSVDSDPNNILSSTRANVKIIRKGRFK